MFIPNVKSSTYPENKNRSSSNTLHNQVLKSTNKAKYLGVTITNDLTCNHHINNITNKANVSLRFIKRNVNKN